MVTSVRTQSLTFASDPLWESALHPAKAAQWSELLAAAAEPWAHHIRQGSPADSELTAGPRLRGTPWLRSRWFVGPQRRHSVSSVRA